MRSFALGRTASKWWGRDVHPGLPTPQLLLTFRIANSHCQCGFTRSLVSGWVHRQKKEKKCHYFRGREYRMTQMRRDSCCLSSPYILPTPEPPCPLTSCQLCTPSSTMLPPISTCSTRKANRPKFLSAPRHTLSTARTFAYTSGT